MALLDIFNSLWDSTLGGMIDSSMDSLGATRHGRDQYVNMENQRELMALENQYHQENFDREFALQNAEFNRRYNQIESPSAQMRMYADAGLNPSALVQKSGAGFMPSPATNASSVSPAAVVAPSSAPAGESKSSVDYLDALSRMKLSDAQSREIYDLLAGKLREQDDAHEIAGNIVAYKQIQNQIYKTYGENKEAAIVANLIEEGQTEYFKGQYYAANKKYLDALEVCANDEHAKNEKELPLLRMYIWSLIQSNNAKSKADISQAGYYSALSSTENALREFKKTLMGNEVKVSNDTLQASIDEIIAQSKAAKVLPKQMEIDLQKAIKENNIYYLREIVGILEDGISSVGAIYGPWKVGKALSVRNKIEADYKQWMMDNKVTEKISDSYNSKGKMTRRVHSYGRRRPQK